MKGKSRAAKPIPLGEPCPVEPSPVEESRPVELYLTCCTGSRSKPTGLYIPPECFIFYGLSHNRGRYYTDSFIWFLHQK